MSSLLRRKDGREGQALLMATLGLFLLFGMIALVIDLGWAYYKKQSGQSAADSAALSAAVYALNNGHTCGQKGVICATSAYNCANPPVNPPTSNLEAGCLYAAANGYRNAGNQSVSLTADYSEPPGAHGNSETYWVQARVAETMPSFFFIQPSGGAGLLLIGLTTSSTSSVSTAAITITPNSSCIYVLDSGNTAEAFKMSGSASVTSSCGIYVNSSSTSAVSIGGSASVHAAQILVHGSYTKSNNSTLSPTPTTGADAVVDPLLNMPAPSFGGCDYNNWSWPSSGSVALNPGVYCGGISITGSGIVTFNPGLYVINGGGFNFGGSAALVGAHVMFYITGDSTHPAAPLNASGTGVISFSAPDSGVYEGLLFFQNRNVTYTTSNTFNGNNASATTGAFYFPTTSLSYSGSSTGRYQALVAKKITMTGNSNFLNDPSGSYTALASKSSALIQ